MSSKSIAISKFFDKDAAFRNKNTIFARNLKIQTYIVDMINITFPDGSVRSYEQGVTGFQIAESISPALARSVVSC